MGEKKKKKRWKRNRWIQKKIDGSKIWDCRVSRSPEHEVKSKIGIKFVNKKIIEEYSVKIYKIDPYFYEHYKEKMQVDKSGCK